MMNFFSVDLDVVAFEIFSIRLVGPAVDLCVRRVNQKNLPMEAPYIVAHLEIIVVPHTGQALAKLWAARSRHNTGIPKGPENFLSGA